MVTIIIKSRARLLLPFEPPISPSLPLASWMHLRADSLLAGGRASSLSVQLSSEGMASSSSRTPIGAGNGNGSGSGSGDPASERERERDGATTAARRRALWVEG